MTETQQMCRYLGPQLSFTTLCGLHIQYEVNRCQQKVRTVGLGDERVYGLQSIGRQLHVLSQHDDGNLWVDLFDLSRHHSAIQKAQLVVEHNCIHRPRHKEPQTIGTVSSG